MRPPATNFLHYLYYYYKQLMLKSKKISQSNIVVFWAKFSDPTNGRNP